MRYFLVFVWIVNLAILANAAILYEGGELDFENGFIYHPSIWPGREYDVVGTGWGYWGQRAVWHPPEHQHGHANFNENKNPFNISRGERSQEITMTSANGDAIMYYTVTVPSNHYIRFSVDAITTWSEDQLQMRITAGQGGTVNFTGVTDPFALGLDWQQWDITLSNGQFYTATYTTVSQGTQMTFYIWMRHYWASTTGATLCFDNLRVYDDGPAHGSPIPTATFTPVVLATNTPTPAPTGQPVLGDNVLLNPSFEDAITSFEPWVQAQSGAGALEINKKVWQPDPDIAQDGDNYIGCARQVDAQSTSTVMYQTISVTQGQPYCLDGYFVTGSEPSAWAQCRMWVVDGEYPGAIPAIPAGVDTGTTQDFRSWTFFVQNEHFVPTGTTATVIVAFTVGGAQWAVVGAHADMLGLWEVLSVSDSPTPAPPATATPTPTSIVEVPTHTPTISTCTFHTADQTDNWQLDFNLSLLLIQRFNSGGEYSCGDATDGYQIGAGPRDCPPHDTDYNQNWMLDFPEMLRFIQFFNMGYHCTDDPLSPDGYAPGPSPVQR